MTALSDVLVDIARSDASRPNKPTEFRLMQASGAFDFRFEELGLEIESGFSAGSFNGVAKVTYWSDPEEGLEWFVGDILLDCSRWNGTDYDVRTVTLESGDPMHLQIWSALNDGAFKDSIEARVREQL